MALEPIWTGSQLLRKLLADFLDRRLSAGDFSRDIEVAYNEAVDGAALTSAEHPIFERLFDEVVWFDPRPTEAWEYPHYRTEAQIRIAGAKAAEELSRL